jgi:DNA primase
LAEDRVALVKRVKEANDIVEVVGSYLTLRPAGGTFKALCPFHDDARPSFDVDPRRQRYRCWSCNKYGDVISFVQEHERVDFREALELLARRAGISLEKNGDEQHARTRARMLDVMRWAAEQFQLCLLDGDSPGAEAARLYLGERHLSGEIVRRFGVGYAPLAGDWLVRRAADAKHPVELLEKVGLIGRRSQGDGWYDRFRDRIMFPIRDVQGRPVGFGGRVLPSSALAARGPKYYNSSDTLLFKKSELLYGIDEARHAAAKAGYLAVVEGYTDVLMAHQMGVANVVATMGTALNARHVQHLRRFAPRVILVFDADAGGDTGVDRALEIFVGQDVDLRVATLPEGLDPCDLLVKHGADPFRAALTKAVDVLEFKLTRVFETEAADGVEGKRRAVDAVLGVIALAPALPGHAGAVKQELMVTRIAQRLGLKEETVWARLRELRAGKQAHGPQAHGSQPVGQRSSKAPPLERELLTVLLADPGLVPAAAAEVAPKELQHPGLRLLLEGLYRLQAEGLRPELDGLRSRIEKPDLLAAALRLQEVGQLIPDRAKALADLLAEFRGRRESSEKQELQHRLLATGDDAEALALLRRLQNRTGGKVGEPKSAPDTPPPGGPDDVAPVDSR